MTRRDAGRKGGLITLQRYGIDQLREWGKLGGRPRLLTYDDIMRQRECLGQNNNGGNGLPGTSLSQLKALYRLRQRSTGEPQNIEAGAAHNPTAAPAGKERSKPRC